MARIVARSKMRLISRDRPPQAGQASTSRANARRMNWAQVQPRTGGPQAVASAAEGSVPAAPSATGTGSMAGAVPYATTAARHRALGASRPW